jgi:hypothetical protein
VAETGYACRNLVGNTLGKRPLEEEEEEEGEDGYSGNRMYG